MANGTKRKLSQSNEPESETHPETQQDGEETELCPGCTDESRMSAESAAETKWVRCDGCKLWHHWHCVGKGNDLELVARWYCQPCLDADPKRSITTRAPARKSHRRRAQRDYSLNGPGTTSDRDASKWTRMLEGKTILEHKFHKMDGHRVTVEWLDEDDQAMTEPIIIEEPEGLDMRMPDNTLTVEDIAKTLGESTPLEVIDVASQSGAHGWTLGKWSQYIRQAPAEREKVLNVISLEISGTPLADHITPPRIVRELDWVEKHWPSSRKGKGHHYPKVQLYCLMGVESAWTDWHVDFAGSSVYYHVLKGQKVFYFIKPTPANLAAYEKWSGSEIQSHAWLGDMVDEVFKVTLQEGNTMIIPSGWIHAVHTPVDTIVFGGNFLHSYDMAMQLKIRQIEVSTHVPKKFCFPMFSKLCWYVAEKYLRDLKANEALPSRVTSSLRFLIAHLMSEVHTLERGSDNAKRETKEQVPTDKVKDAAALAREFRWRLRLASGDTSDDEMTTGARPAKRKRPDREISVVSESKFRNFIPRRWDYIFDEPEQAEMETVQATRLIREDEWERQWSQWPRKELSEGDMTEAQVERKRSTLTRMRKTTAGFERERFERVSETWNWDPS